MGAAMRPLGEDTPRAAIVSAAALARDGDAWDALLAHADEPNPHYGRQAVEAHRANGLAPADLEVLVVRRSGRLVAALPAVVPPPGRRQAPASPFLSAYVTGTAPLIAADASPAVFAAFVEGLAQASAGRPWRWPLLAEGPASARLTAAMEGAGWQVGVVESFARPLFLRRPDLAAAQAAPASRSRTRGVRRRLRRLADRGTVTFETADSGGGLREALDAFLRLEAEGWKGARRTALASRRNTEAFARKMFSGGDGPVRPRIDVMRLDGRPIAASLALVAGGVATLFKSAYAEGDRALAPGILLEWELIRALHEDRFAEKLDSATLPGSVLESLYPDRVTVLDLVAVPPSRDGPPPALAPLITKARRQLRLRRTLKRVSRKLGWR